MSDIKLQKIILPPDFIDLSFGEPKIIAEACMRNINFAGSSFAMPDLSSLSQYEYQPAQGNLKLISLLENKYNARVVVTNGAKHGLAAVFHVLKKHGYNDIYYDVPYYPANPSLTENEGLERNPSIDNADVLLLTSPNNPDGRVYTNEYMNSLMNSKYVIHDGAYGTPIYMPNGYVPEKVGHIQIYSMSKMYGLSGLRIGYVVCHDERFFQDIVNYVETTTAGVSTASQEIAYNIEKHFLDNPDRLSIFEQESRDAIEKNRQLLTLLDPDVLALVKCESNSMFGWFKKGPKLDYMKAKVYMLDGSIFGDNTMIRMNVAVPYDTLKEAIDRLNKVN